jgi:hypothetical protein
MVRTKLVGNLAVLESNDCRQSRHLGTHLSARDHSKVVRGGSELGRYEITNSALSCNRKHLNRAHHAAAASGQTIAHLEFSCELWVLVDVYCHEIESRSRRRDLFLRRVSVAGTSARQKHTKRGVRTLHG